MIELVYLGRTRQDFIAAGIKEYSKRLTPFVKIRQTVIPDLKPSPALSRSAHKKKEARKILKHLQKSKYVIALDERGKSYNSIDFAGFLAEKLGRTDLIFIVGGIYGLGDEVKERADLCLSFSEFTFTHQMIRLILMEQLYRAITIINKKKYHY